VDQAAATADQPLIADRYRVERKLGKGGMAVVYEVTDLPTGQRLALKQLLEKLADREGPALQFRREFHTMARLQHPQVVQVYDYGVAGGLPYYTMELLDGRDLRQLAPAEPRQAGFLLRDLASALAYLHSRRFVHRDVSPVNVRCTADGRAKLMDFGVLTTPGFCRDVAGTPAHVAPEVVRGLPIDHRADLFSFGALAYWLVTGAKAYPARSFQELEETWQRNVRPPSSLAPQVPEALDELILALLSLDAVARPRSAAEVIDRLGGILGLDPAPELEVAHSYLSSTTLVGRKRELERIRTCVSSSLGGRGGFVLLEGPSGIGKSRLLREARLEAQIASATVVEARCHPQGGAYSVLRDLADGLLAAVPRAARDAARKGSPVLRRAIPELEKEYASATSGEVSSPGRDERVAVQREVTRWFMDVSREHAVVLAVDDLQRADEGSAAVLASLARNTNDHELLCMCTVRTDESSRMPLAMATVRDVAVRLRIQGLSEEDTEELIRATFGNVPHAGRLGRWLFQVTGGNPLHCTEIPRQLVDRGVIRYVDGGWVIDEGFDENALPQFLTDAMDERIGKISDSARALAEVLSVHGAELSLDLCVRLAEEDDEREVFNALDQLLHEEILEGGGATYRFRHDGVREALLRNLDAERKQRLHLRVGRTLEQQGEVGPEREGEVGWHLLQGGDELRGAHLLERAGQRLYEMQSFAEAMPMLEAALEVFERHGYSPRRCQGLRSILLLGGVMADRTLALRHAERTLEAYRRYGGLHVAARLGRVLGRPIALGIGLLTAGLRWLLSPPRRRGPGPIPAVRELFKATAYTNSSLSTTWDVARLRRVAGLLRPVAISPKKVSYAMWAICSNYAEFRLGRFGTLRSNARQALHALAQDNKTPVARLEKLAAESACHWSLGVSALWRGESDYFEEVAELERTPAHVAASGRLQLQVMYHRLRGEEEDAKEEERQLEMYMVETGSGWPFRVALVYYSSLIYGILGDVMGLKRSVEELVRMRGEGFDFDFFVELARGEYYRQRGNYQKSEQHLQEALQLTTEEHIRDRSAALLALSDTLYALGQYERARQVAEQGVEINEDPELQVLLVRVRGARTLAQAEWALGQQERAWQRLQHALELLGNVDNPAALGMLQEARARLAYESGDVESYREAYDAAVQAYRMTGNSALLGRLQRLPDPARMGESQPADSSKDASISETVTSTAATAAAGAHASSVDSALTSAQGSLERATRMLDLLMQVSSGVSGFLYFRRKGALKLAAAIPEAEPPTGLREALRNMLDRDVAPEVSQQVPRAGTMPRGWHAVLLETTTEQGESVRVGAAAIQEGALDFEPIDPSLVQRVSRVLLEAGDVTWSEGNG
jgi:serine/threonine protein kinase/tetratricopeptide (TPR) repeat protein